MHSKCSVHAISYLQTHSDGFWVSWVVVSSDSVQSMMRSVSWKQYGLKVEFCCRHDTPSHYHHHADFLTCIENIRWKILDACVNVCWVYSVESMSNKKMYIVLSSTFLTFFAICGVVCDKLAHSSLGDRKDISITHLIIIIKSEVSSFPVVVILLSVSYMSRENWFLFLLTVQFCDARK